MHKKDILHDQNSSNINKIYKFGKKNPHIKCLKPLLRMGWHLKMMFKTEKIPHFVRNRKTISIKSPPPSTPRDADPNPKEQNQHPTRRRETMTKK